jgi:hypothetical protein
MKLTPSDLLYLRKRTLARWMEVPNEGRLPGRNDFLTTEERTSIAWLEACMEFLHVREGGPVVHVELDTEPHEPVE